MFVVDITKPPVAPPNRSFIMLPFIGRLETEESKKVSQEYEKYLQNYSNELQPNKRGSI